MDSAGFARLSSMLRWSARILTQICDWTRERVARRLNEQTMDRSPRNSLPDWFVAQAADVRY
jgi:hypothetical protein